MKSTVRYPSPLLKWFIPKGLEITIIGENMEKTETFTLGGNVKWSRSLVFLINFTVSF